MYIVPKEKGDGQSVAYLRDYIRAALKDAELAPPDKEQAGEHHESLYTLYEAHKRGGNTMAAASWEAVKKMRPMLAEHDPDSPSVPFAKPDDDMIAIELASKIGEQANFFHSQWKLYDTGCWHEQQVSEFRRYIRRELRSWRGRGVVVSQNRIKSLTSMLEDDLFIPDREILHAQREQARYINLRNGLFNLDTMRLEAHRPDLYFTTQLSFDYDPHATANTFRQYLNSSLVHPDGTTDFTLTELVLEALGYSMTARTDLKASFWLVGQKDSGKSTFIALIKALMGDLHATIDLTQLGTNRFLLGGIVGKRVVTFTEASSTTVLPDALYKTLVGGSDEIYADVKNRDPICFRPEAKVWWAMNEMPRMGDRSGATTRRLVMIPFKQTIPEHKRISNLEARLASERSGIFNMVLDHLIELSERGAFIKCQQSEEMRIEYIQENDTEATFIEECARQGKGLRVPAGQLYARYAGWCEANGFKPKNANQVAKEWRRLGFESLNSGGKWWINVELITL